MRSGQLVAQSARVGSAKDAFLRMQGDAGNPIRVTVSIKDYNFAPIFNLAGMLKIDSFTAMPVRPSTTMYYWQVDPGGGKG